MNVSLVAQILSNTVSNALSLMYGEEVSATFEFINYMNKWFDIITSTNLYTSNRTLNVNVAPFASGLDARLHWLRYDFLLYFDTWKTNVEQRQGVFTKGLISKMQIRQQTLKGLKITTISVIECVKKCYFQRCTICPHIPIIRLID